MNPFVALRGFFTRNPQHLSTVVVYESTGHTRHLTTERLDTASAKHLIKHLLKLECVWLVEIDGEPFYAKGSNIEHLKG